MEAQALIRLADSVWSGREAVNATMEELARYIYPEARGFTAKPSESDEGRQEIWDSTPEEAAGMLAAALGGLLTNPSSDWFSLDLVGEDEADEGAGDWLTEIARTMLDAFAAPESRFYQEVDAFYMELAALAWAVLFIEYRDGKSLLYQAVPVSQCAIAENAEGMVDTLVRRWTMTAAQIVEEFAGGESAAGALPDAVKEAAAKNPQQSFELTHLVTPWVKLPADVAPHEGRNSAHLYASYVFMKDADKPLQVSGYREFPFAVARWAKRPGEVYGRGCGHKALPDIRVLNRVSLSQLDAAEKSSNPPLLVPDDSVLAGQKINTFAGGITYWRPSGGEIAPLPIATDLSAMQAIREERQDAIRRAFLNDRLLLAEGPQMTATEAMLRDRKQALVLGPVNGRLQVEMLGPLIERSFNLLLRAGRLPEPPDSLAGREFRVRYVSPISRGQSKGDAEGFNYALQYTAPLIEMRPELMDNFDGDAIVRDTQDVFGYPAKYLVDEKKMQETRKARAEAAERAAQQQAALQAAELAAKSGGGQGAGQAAGPELMQGAV